MTRISSVSFSLNQFTEVSLLLTQLSELRSNFKIKWIFIVVVAAVRFFCDLTSPQLLKRQTLAEALLVIHSKTNKSK